jgi:two-component system response regulator RegA
MTSQPLMLIVEDDEALRRRLARAMAERGFDVAEAGSVPEAERRIADDPPEFAVLDLRIPGGYGLDLIATLKAADPNTRIVVLTGYGSIATAIDAVRRGAVHYLTKPVDVDDILAAFDRGGETTSANAVLPMSLDRVEWEHINRVLVDCGGNVSEAARLLGLHRRSLQRKLAKYPRPI